MSISKLKWKEQTFLVYVWLLCGHLEVCFLQGLPCAITGKAQVIIHLRICAGEQVLTQIPLVAEEAVEKLTWGQMFLRILKKLCMARYADR